MSVGLDERFEPDDPQRRRPGRERGALPVARQPTAVSATSRPATSPSFSGDCADRRPAPFHRSRRPGHDGRAMSPADAHVAVDLEDLTIDVQLQAGPGALRAGRPGDGRDPDHRAGRPARSPPTSSSRASTRSCTRSALRARSNVLERAASAGSSSGILQSFARTGSRTGWKPAAAARRAAAGATFATTSATSSSFELIRRTRTVAGRSRSTSSTT